MAHKITGLFTFTLMIVSLSILPYSVGANGVEGAIIPASTAICLSSARCCGEMYSALKG